jgi:ABC-type sugar transport system ATPase subunit
VNGVPALECRALAVGRGATPVADGIDLRLADGELLAVLGASGTGKTTLLDTIAGFIAPLQGEIHLGGRPASDPRHCEPPERRSVGVVFQQYALWPHMSVLDIVGYPLRRAGRGRSTARAEAAALLERLDIATLADRHPAELSGGEQQRVALARALARHPALFLFDEPTAHLDAPLRSVVLDEIARHRTESGAAAVYATHDAAEALAIADTVAVLDHGRLVQSGPPIEVYQHPISLSVARLAGPACVLTAAVRPLTDATAKVTIGSITDTVACTAAGLNSRQTTSLLVRPDWAVLDGPFDAVAVRIRFRGPHTDYTLETPAGLLDLRVAGPPQHAVGDRVTWGLSRVWPLPDDAAVALDGPPPDVAVFPQEAAEDIVH